MIPRCQRIADLTRGRSAPDPRPGPSPRFRHALEWGRPALAGLFLLDSKNYSGEASIEAGELRVRWLEDPEVGWVCHGMVSRMRAASAELKERVEAATGVRVWVQPVVVLWMPFPQGVAQLSDVFFVQGECLADWLRKRGPHGRSFDPERISDFLQGKAAATAPAPQGSLPS
jgi:hypothetical protein